MRNWIVWGLPVFIALLTFGTPMKGWADDIEDNLSDNNVAVDQAIAFDEIEVEDIANDDLEGKNNANDNAIAFDEIEIEDVANDDHSDTQVGKNNANDNSIAFDEIEIEDVANDDHSDNLEGKINANDNSLVVAVEDISVAVAASTLSGTVTGNNVVAVGALLGLGEIETGDNYLATGCNYTVTGINQNAQNTGINSLLQQSVNVQANLDF